MAKKPTAEEIAAMEAALMQPVIASEPIPGGPAEKPKGRIVDATKAGEAFVFTGAKPPKKRNGER